MIGNGRFIAIYLLLIIAGLYVHLHADIVVPMNRSFSQFPLVVKDWKMISQTEFDDRVLDVLKPTDYLSRDYEGADGRALNLYIGYHGGGRSGGEIHSPKHCLPGSGWFEASSTREYLDVGGEKINLVRAVYRKGEVRTLFYYWFQVQDRTISDEYSLKLAEVVNSLLHRRRDASFVRISIPLGGNEEQSRADGVRFIKDFYPMIRGYLPH